MTISTSPPVPLLILAGAGTGAVGAAWILTLFLRGKSAALRHFIWLLAFAASLAALPIARLHTRIDLPILPHADARASVPVFQAGALAAPSSMDLPPEPLTSASQPAPEPQSGHALAFNIWWAIWIAGAALQFLRICNSHARLRRMAAIAGAAPSADLLLQLSTAKDFFRMKRAVRLLLTPEARLPFCYGVFQPVIVFPSDSREWCAERTRVCLTHEMAHIVRGDLFAILVAQCVCTLCWFNPFVWLAARILRDEAENAADDLVLSRDIAPETYASNLVAITEECHAFDLAPGFALSIARANRLTPRIVAILDSSLYRKSPRLGTIAALSLLAGCTMVALMTVRLTPAAAPLPDSTPSSGVIDYVYETNPQKIKPKLYNWEVKLDAADSHAGPYEILEVTSPVSSGSTATSARVLIAPEMIIPNSAGIIDFMLYLGQKEPARDPAAPGYILQPIKYSGIGSETGAANKIDLPGSVIDDAFPSGEGTKLVDGRLALIQFITTDDHGKKVRTDVVLSRASAFPQFGKNESVAKIPSAIGWDAGECAKPMMLPGNYEASTDGNGSYTIRCLDLPHSAPGHNIIVISFQASNAVRPVAYLRRMPLTINGYQTTWGIYKTTANGAPIIRKEAIISNFLPRHPLNHGADYISIRIDADSQEVIDRLTPVAGGILRDAD